MGFAVSGVNCAAVTPLNADLSPDLALFAEHCRRLVADGCHGIALLGTTGEANSFSVAERQTILEAAVASGVGTDRLLPGVGVAAGPETVALCRHALRLGVTRVVMLPPFYYKGVTDEGLFASYAKVIEAVADDRLRLVLYHIPQTSAVPLSLALVARLATAFPGIVVGIKDSSGDFANMQALVGTAPDFAVLTGADPLLLPLLKEGGAGCITAVANLAADSLRGIYDHHADPTRAAEIESAQARLVAWRALASTYTQLTTIKAMLAIRDNNPGWTRVRPPLVPVEGEALAAIRQKFMTLP